MTRYGALFLAIGLTLAPAAGALLNVWFVIPLAGFVLLSLVGLRDITRKRHSILHNCPILGHMRFLFVGIRPEIRQHLIESDQDEEPFSRDVRSIVYQCAKGVEDKRPFGQCHTGAERWRSNGRVRP